MARRAARTSRTRSPSRTLSSSHSARSSALLIVFILLLTACAQSPHRVLTLNSGDALTLTTGANRTVMINGLEYRFLLVKSGADGATLRVNAQDFTLRTGEEFSFGDFLIRLDEGGRAGATFMIRQNT